MRTEHRSPRDGLALSVVLATRNRSAMLKQTLGHLEQQDLRTHRWEVIVVDNGSTDETQKVLESFQSRLRLLPLYEGQPGKSRALNKAMGHLSGDLVVFTDDDVIPEANWLSSLLAAAERWPDDSIFGGCIEPVLPTDSPAWMRDWNIRYSGVAFSRYAPRESEGPTNRRPLGPNVAIRRRALDGKTFCETLGPGTSYPLGDESELLKRLGDEGSRFIYVPSATVKHVVPEEETRPRALADRAFSYGRGELRVQSPPLARSVGGVPLYLWRKTATAWVRHALSVFGDESSRVESRMSLYRFYGNMDELKRQARERRDAKMVADNGHEPKRLRIAFLAGTFPVRSQTFVQRKMDFLLREGHDVHVFCVRSETELAAFHRWRKRIHYLPSSLASGPSIRMVTGLFAAVATGKLSLRKIWAVQRDIKRQGGARATSLGALVELADETWDIVHAQFLTSLDLITGVRDFIRCPVVASVYGHEATVSRHQPGAEARMKQQIRSIDALTYSSRFLQDALADLVPVGMQHIVLPPEVDTDMFRPRERTRVQDPVRLLSVGRLHWTKAFVYALSAIRILLDRGMNCTYRILGEGPARSEIEYAIRELGLQNAVRLDGAASTEDVATAMEWADVLLAPSVKEEFGVAILEAQSAGLPVVASRVGGIPEASREGVTSLLVEPRKPEELASAIRQLAQDPELYQSFSQEGPRFAEEFAGSKIGAQLVEFYRAAIRNWQSVVHGGNREATPRHQEAKTAHRPTTNEAQPVLVRRERSS